MGMLQIGVERNRLAVIGDRQDGKFFGLRSVGRCRGNSDLVTGFPAGAFLDDELIATGARRYLKLRPAFLFRIRRMNFDPTSRTHCH